MQWRKDATLIEIKKLFITKFQQYFYKYNVTNKVCTQHNVQNIWNIKISMIGQVIYLYKNVWMYNWYIFVTNEGPIYILGKVPIHE